MGESRVNKKNGRKTGKIMATQKIGDVIKKLLTKTGVSADKVSRITTALESVELDIEDEDVTAITDSLMNQQEAETKLSGRFRESEGKGKADAYDTIDKKILTKYKRLLTDEERVKYDALTSTVDKAEFMIDSLEKKGGGEQYKKAYNDLHAQIEKDYVSKSKYEEVEKELLPAHEEKFFAKVLQKAHGNKKLSNDARETRFFDNNFILSYKDKLKSLGYKVDFKGEKVFNKDDTPALNGVEEINPYSLIESVIDDTPEWQKKSDGEHKSDNHEVTVPANNGDLTPAQQKNFDRMRK